ncbi:hypothetical protein COCOBI_pt-1680 (chloroplast) [Coccomyxa sp. Obi]|nr:hypothetical protein COCOBI_pt-1680 [Coccomyxa sp. Obi]
MQSKLLVRGTPTICKARLRRWYSLHKMPFIPDSGHFPFVGLLGRGFVRYPSDWVGGRGVGFDGLASLQDARPCIPKGCKRGEVLGAGAPMRSNSPNHNHSRTPVSPVRHCF